MLGFPLRGARVLVAEDEPIIAFDVASILIEAGAVILGPAFSPERAIELATERDPACGVLDVNLRDGLVFAVAQILRRKGAGIVFYTSIEAFR